MKKFVQITVLALSLCLPHLAWCDGLAPVSSVSPENERIPLYKVVTEIPTTAWQGLKASFSKEALPGWALALGSSTVLYHYDPDILSSVQSTGREWGLGNSVNYKSVINVGSLTLWSAPTDTAGWLYYMGDGTIPILISAGMITDGYFASHSRLYNAGIEMANGLFTAAIFDQVLKRVAGRESPSAASEPRGRFRPFPSFKAYSQKTSKYDALASGHIMTATVMFTVIEQEFPEYNNFMYPFEALWLTALGLGMINVGVHWASDYPLGIAMGYVFGKAAVVMHHPDKTNTATAANWRFFPGVNLETGTTTLNALHKF